MKGRLNIVLGLFGAIVCGFIIVRGLVASGSPEWLAMMIGAGASAGLAHHFVWAKISEK